MRKLTLFFAFLLSVMGVTQTWAETLTADFNSGLPDGWSIVGDLTRNIDRARSGSGVWTSSKSDNANYLVTEAVEGTITFYARAYNKSTNAYVFIYAYDGSALGTQLYMTSNMKTSSTPSFSSYTADLGSYTGQVAIALNYAAIDDVTYTQYIQSDGPALVVTDGTKKLTSPYSYDFGLTTAGTTKSFTLSNPGTEALDISVVETGSFGATLSASTIAAGGDVSLTVRMPETTGSSSITITPDVTSEINPFVINVGGTIRDESKYYTNFADGFGDWTQSKSGNAEYWLTSTDGYAKHTYKYANHDLISPKLTFTEGEVVMFRAQYNTEDAVSSYGSTPPQLNVFLSTNGTNWESAPVLTVEASELTTNPTQWINKSFIVPSSSYKYFKFSGRLIKITDVYGGQVPSVNPMEVMLDDEPVGETVAFGSVNKSTTKTFTVANNSNENLSGGSISLSGDDAASFSLSKTYLMVAAHGTNTFDVTFNSTDEDVEKTATVTLSAGELTKSFTVTGTYVNMWSEDFEGNALPEGWEIEGNASKWTFANGVATGAYENGANYLVTPELIVESGASMTFEAKANSYNTDIIVYYKKDGVMSNAIINENRNTQSDYETFTISGLEAGTYKFCFKADNYSLDNFEGFKLAAAKEHEAEIKSSAIPATGNQYVEYTASVDVKVLGTSDEELTAKFFIGDTQYGEDVVKTVTSGETETFTVTFAPDAAVSGDAYFTITNNDIDLTTEPTAVTIVGAYALSEADTENNVEEGNYPVVELTFTVKNGWNSIALPFAVSDPTVFGESVRVYSLDSFAEGTLSFSEKNTMYGCDPYIIYVEGAKTGPFILNNVSISDSQANESNCSATRYSGDYSATHKGTWTKMSAEGLYGIVNATGDIRLGTSNATFKAFRSYFDLTYPEGTSIKMNFVNNDGVSTTINAAEVLDELNGDIYDMSGRKVSKVQKGIYIQNGKKVVIK